MTDIIWERAIALFGMSLWIAFPIGIILSIIRLDRMAHRTALHPATFYPNVSEGPYHFVLNAAQAGESSEEEKQEDYENHNEEWEEESMENEGGGHPTEEENPLLHYLRGREKLHEKGGMNPPGE